MPDNSIFFVCCVALQVCKSQHSNDVLESREDALEWLARNNVPDNSDQHEELMALFNRV